MSWQWQPLLLAGTEELSLVPLPSVVYAVPFEETPRARIRPAFFWGVVTPAASPAPPITATLSVFPIDVVQSKRRSGEKREFFWGILTPAAAPGAPAITATLPVYPIDVVQSRRRSGERRELFWPARLPDVPGMVAALAVYPQRAAVARRSLQRRPYHVEPVTIIANPTVVLPVGPAGVAVLAMATESGAKVTYSFQTNVLKAFSGKEARVGVVGAPRQTFSFAAVLDDDGTRQALSMLAGFAPSAPVFQLALAFEELTVVSSVGSGVFVNPAALAMCDWAVPGQRFVVIAKNGAVSPVATVQAAAVGTIGSDINLTAYALEGARVMPLVGVYLEPDQAFSRHVINAGRIELVARAIRQRYGSTTFQSPSVGVGAAVAMFDGLPVWDRGVALELAGQGIRSGSTILDLGGRVGSAAAFAEADWDRTLAIESHKQSEWQWFKRFLATIDGARAAFLLATGRPDLIAVGDASSGTLTVQGPPTANAPDYVGVWFSSAAHRRLKLVMMDGTVAYRSVTSCADNGNGTQSLALSSVLAGVIARVEFLELCRLETSDTGPLEVLVTWEGTIFSSTLAARVVQQ